MIFMWHDPDHIDASKWSEYKPGMSALETGAGSLSTAMKIVRDGLRGNYTHFVLSYPVAMHGPPTSGNPHSWRAHFNGKFEPVIRR